MQVIPDHISPRKAELLPLTGIRALAATWVLLYHLKGEIATASPVLASLLSPFIGQGYLGVDLFFILSGFILTYNYKEKFPRFQFRLYLSFLWMRPLTKSTWNKAPTAN